MEQYVPVEQQEWNLSINDFPSGLEYILVTLNDEIPLSEAVSLVMDM